jgi:hypothetical protein
MNVTWLPFACTDPANDAYYGCFNQANLGSIPPGGIPVPPSGGEADAGSDDGAAPADGGTGDTDAGSSGGACSGLSPDAGVPSPVISTFRFTVPGDSVSLHPPVPGSVAPYGLEILFNVACAGEVKIVPLDSNNGNPQQVPVQCVDDSNGQPRGPDDYVFGFTRVYTYEADSGITNTNPVVSGVDFPDPAPPMGWPTCFQGSSPTYTSGVLVLAACTPDTKSCPSVKLGPIVPSSSQETDPQNNRKELLWVDYYSTFGGFNSSSKLLYDPSGANVGGLAKTDTEFQPPRIGFGDVLDGYIFMVAHDNRGGASWVTLPVHIQ